MLWHNPVDNKSLRLSLPGYTFLLKELKLETYQFVLSRPLTNKNLIQLERLFPGPYYYLTSASKFILIDDQDASWLQLLGGDLVSYLDNLENDL